MSVLDLDVLVVVAHVIQVERPWACRDVVPLFFVIAVCYCCICTMLLYWAVVVPGCCCTGLLLLLLWLLLLLLLLCLLPAVLAAAADVAAVVVAIVAVAFCCGCWCCCGLLLFVTLAPLLLYRFLYTTVYYRLFFCTCFFCCCCGSEVLTSWLLVLQSLCTLRHSNTQYQNVRDCIVTSYVSLDDVTCYAREKRLGFLHSASERRISSNIARWRVILADGDKLGACWAISLYAIFT